jgi:hypothetical protein
MEHNQSLALQAPRTTEPTAIVRCHISSYTPEIHDFYGDSAAVELKMSRVDMGLAERRMFLLAIESADRAELRLFEHVEGATWAVSARRAGDTRDVGAKVADMIFENKGRFCVGESTQKLVDEIYGEFELLGNVEVGHDPVAVFGPVVREYAGDGYLRVTAGLLC